MKRFCRFVLKLVLVFLPIIGIITSIGAPKSFLNNCSYAKRKIVNVKNKKFAARPGVEEGDDTARIQRAIATLGNCSALYFPRGVYKVGRPNPSLGISPNLLLPENISDLVIYGAGENSKDELRSRILYYYSDPRGLVTTNNPEIRYKNSLLIIPSGNNITISDLSFESAVSIPRDFGSYEGTIMGIWAKAVSNASFNNIRVKGFNYSGLTVGTSSLNDQNIARNVSVSDSEFIANRSAGMNVSSADTVVVDSNEFTSNGLYGDGGTGYGFAGNAGTRPRNIIVKNNKAFYNVRKGIDFHAGENVIIENNEVKGNGLYGIYVTAQGDVQIVNNKISEMNRGTTRVVHGLSSPNNSLDYKDIIRGIWFGFYENSRKQLSVATTYTVRDNKIFNFFEDEMNLPTPLGTDTFIANPLEVAVDILTAKVIVENNEIDMSYKVKIKKDKSEIRLGKVNRFLSIDGRSFSPAALPAGPQTNLDGGIDFQIAKNKFKARLKSNFAPFYFANAKKIDFQSNRIHILPINDNEQIVEQYITADTKFALSSVSVLGNVSLRRSGMQERVQGRQPKQAAQFNNYIED